MAMFSTTTYTPDNLLAGNAHLLKSRKVIILAGQVVSAGAVLGKVTASGKYVLSLQASADGSETPDLILLEDVDASGGDKEALAAERGDFIEGALTIGTGHTADSIREGLRVKGITMTKAI